MYSSSGPIVRSIGIKKDIRFYRSETYASYWFLSLNSFLGKRGDSYDRFLIRIREMYESINIVFQILSSLSTPKDDQILKRPQLKHSNLDFFNFVNELQKVQLNKYTKYTSMESLIKHFKQYSDGVRILHL
jgi:NADH-quinone oxidoreductase subunit D